MKTAVMIAVLWLAGIAGLGDGIVWGVVISVPGLAVFAVAVRELARGRHGSFAAWACCALAAIGCLCLVGLANIHLHEFTGGGPGCDYMAQNCDPQPLVGLGHALALILFIGAGVLLLRLVRAASSRAAVPTGTAATGLSE
ncbi:MAG TPA: hypothetical protein VFB58_09050 [Chloroflexota bacterium]|nr:hypothetical protein [Chloroflexota bacterium]